jgi:DNA-binding SARP family transcriptional activator
METIRANLLGKFYMEDNSAVPINIQGRKVQELLCYLLVFRKRPHPRETLAVALWEDNSSEQSKCYLRRTLWQLQQTIDAKVERDCPLLMVEPDWIQVNPQAPLWLDVDVLESAYRQVKGVPGEELDQRSAQMLHEAAGLYCGPLLEGWYQTWCICERERLQHVYLIMLDKLMRYCEVQGDFEAGIAYGRQILRCDRAREYTHRQLMRLLYLARDRSGALRQYERCLNALREELDVDPTQRTQQLYREIRQDALSLSLPLHWDRAYTAQAEPAQLQQLMAELEKVQRDLIHLNQSLMHASELFDGFFAPENNTKIAR